MTTLQLLKLLRHGRLVKLSIVEVGDESLVNKIATSNSSVRGGGDIGSPLDMNRLEITLKSLKNSCVGREILLTFDIL